MPLCSTKTLCFSWCFPPSESVWLPCSCSGQAEDFVGGQRQETPGLYPGWDAQHKAAKHMQEEVCNRWRRQMVFAEDSFLRRVNRCFARDKRYEGQGAIARLTSFWMLTEWMQKKWLWWSKNSQEKLERRERKARSRWTSPRSLMTHGGWRLALDGALLKCMGLVLCKMRRRSTAGMTSSRVEEDPVFYRAGWWG